MKNSRVGFLALHGMLSIMLVAGCAGHGPKVDRYRPPTAMTANDVIAEWSRDAWVTARSEGIDATIAILSDPPVPDSELSRALDRYLELDDAAMAERTNDAERLLGAIDDLELDDETARAIFELADLRAAGLPPDLDPRVLRIIEAAIDEWIAAAEQAETDGRFLDADAAWSAVGSIAIGSDRPLVMIDARRRQRRLDGLRGSDPSLGPRDAFEIQRPTVDDAIRALRVVLKYHVDQPTWRLLVEAGFAQIAEAIPTTADGEDRAARLRRFDDAKARFDMETSAVADRSGRLPSSVRRRLAEALESIASAGPAGFEASVVARLFLDGVVAATDLRTNAYFGSRAVQLRRQLDASFVGIGAEIYQTPEGFLLQTMPGSPSARAGLRDGDRLVTVDGRRVDDLTSQDVVDLITGEAGTSVLLTLERSDTADPIDLEIIRGEVDRESVLGWRQIGVDEAGRPEWEWLVDPTAGIVFISIREFREDVVRIFRTALREASDALGPDRSVSGLVIDLRNDPGGLRWVAEDIIDLFLPSGILFSAEGRNDRVRSQSANSFVTRLESLPTVVLVNDASASASEIVAGTLQADADAVVVGERTYGKGSVQTVRPLMNEGWALVTESWFTIPDGHGGRRLIDRSRAGSKWGIEPDLEVGASLEETRSIMTERGRWYSGIGLDVPPDIDAPDSPDLEDRLAATTDRELLLAIALLRARLLPTLPAAATPAQ
ncbi:MAG: S41 family peptidase [Planctomycetota bacterium]